MNESAPYVDAVHAMYDGHSDGNPHIPAWLIIDQRYRNSYVFAGLPPRKPLPRRWYAAGAVHRAPTIAELLGASVEQIAALAQAYHAMRGHLNPIAAADAVMLTWPFEVTE